MPKKNLCLTVGAFLVVLLGSVALAHPPAGIIASFDPETYLLEIRIPHSVASAKGDHYISEIRIYRNGTEIVTQYVQSQFSSQEQRVQYLIIDAVKGDTLTIYARCNKFGEKKVDLILE